MDTLNLFSWFREHHPVVFSFSSNKVASKFDNLHLNLSATVNNRFDKSNTIAQITITEKKIWVKVSNRIDFLFTLMRPKKLLVLAIDSVAPRVEMNQQRVRSFCFERIAQEEGYQAEEDTLDINCAIP